MITFQRAEEKILVEILLCIIQTVKCTRTHISKHALTNQNKLNIKMKLNTSDKIMIESMMEVKKISQENPTFI